MPRPTTRPTAPELLACLNEQGSVKAAAEELGVNRATLHDWLRELGIERGDWRLAEEPEVAASAP